MGAQSWAAAKATRQEILLVNGGQHLGGAALQCPITDTGHPQGALLLFAGLGDVHPPDRRCRVSLAMYRFEHRLDPDVKVLLRLRYRLAIDAWGRATRNLI
jgi:hypothetical protein